VLKFLKTRRIMLKCLQRLFIRQNEKVDPMKYLVVGLGNMGPEYDNTRHNVGFEFVDYLAEKHEKIFKNDRLGDVLEFKQKGRTIILLKPSTYMNRSGKAVKYWMEKKKILQENVLIVLDDLNIDFGKIRLRHKGSDGGHNGLKDIAQTLGGTNYTRLRIGIGSEFSKGQQVDFVLGKWSSEERAELPALLKESEKKMNEHLFHRRPSR
jgi:PTH1 family peptidyl-tRNA hydrolase